MSDDIGDSIRAMERVARSQRLRAIWSMLSPYLLPLLTLAAGWLAHGLFLRDELDANTRAITDLAVKVDGLGGKFEVIDRRILACGKYAAYATAGFQAHEPAKLRTQKRDYAQRYADAFTRIAVAEQKGPEVAFASLFDNVTLP